MSNPEYSVQDLLDGLKKPEACWIYEDIRTEENIFGGETYVVQRSNQELTRAEVKGTISGNRFTASEGTYEGYIDREVNGLQAVAVQCTDGVVIVTKRTIFYQGGKRIEGYWYSVRTPQYPMPIPDQLSPEEAEQIYLLIKEREKECEVMGSRGVSFSRIDHTAVGDKTYYHEQWLWPEALADHYVLKHRVKPSDDFLAFLGWNA